MIQYRAKESRTRVSVDVVRLNIRAAGVVQGVGFRPFVYNLACELGIKGWVRNTSGSVEICAEGSREAVDDFLRRLESDRPPLSRVDTVAHVSADPQGYEAFEVRESEARAGASAVIPPDVALCEDCGREFSDAGDRRSDYAFINCTNCGPRFTIVQRVPYDRPNTTMAAFPMCGECEREYSDPRDRRFHAEPIACPKCGPRVWLEVDSQTVREGVFERAARMLSEGRILAIKGLGGFHLACDARIDEAVRTLRERKGRGAKPFALMVADLAEAEKLCELDSGARELLLSREAPIVVARRKEGSGISEVVAPGNRTLGVMLPYTPLHRLLFRSSPPALIMTSGNLSEEPLVFTNVEARRRLNRLCDAYLMHDRDIQVPCDDSVVRHIGAGKSIMMRRARGYVPGAIELPVACECVLGVGAEQKNTFCLAWDTSAVPSQHIGDLDTAETLDYYHYAIQHFQSLFQKAPSLIAHDLHPDYMSTRCAKERPDARLIGVQHHHAHVASCLAENGRSERCIGVALDGTGFAPDGTIWGGEILVADLARFERLGFFAQVRLPGGESAIRDPRRMAFAYLRAAYRDKADAVCARLGLDFTALEARAVDWQLRTGTQSPMTSSAGRLFDAVSEAIGVCRQRSYEGQPAVELEMAAQELADAPYEVCVRREDGFLVMDGVGLFRAGVDDLLAGTDAAAVSARFHASVIDLVASACAQAREITGLNLAALSGGVFQNAIIHRGLVDRLTRNGFEVLYHRLLPPNDACISLGQVAAAAALANSEVS